MKWRWPLLPSRKRLTAERARSEEATAKVHREVILPLRKMRAENHLTDAIVEDIRRRLKESGS